MDEELAKKIVYLKKHDHYSFNQLYAKFPEVPQQEIQDAYYATIGQTTPETQPIKTNGPKNLRREVLERFMNPAELEAFFKNYSQNLQTRGGTNREFVFSQPFVREDLELLKRYVVTDLETSLKEISKDIGMLENTAYSKITRLAVKILYRHPEVLEELTSE